ncbi:MAG: divalent-cation tolerance protein CutA [Thermoplasmata archaeon]
MTAPPLDPTGADRRLRVVYVSGPDERWARRIAREVVERRLAACASSWPIRSTYRWKGSIEEGEERAMLLKTSPKKLGALFSYLARSHPYEVPDLFELQVPRVHEPFARWLLEEIDPESAEPPARGRPKRPAAPRARAARFRRRTRERRLRP